MRLYVELAKKSFQRQVAYRGATLAGFVTNLFFGALRAAVLIAVFGARGRLAGYTLADAVTYTGITQALIGALALWGWLDMIRTVKSGEVATDLSKPFDYYGYWLAQDAGRAAYQLLARGATIMIAYAVIFGINLPSTAGQWLLLAIGLGLAWLISFGWRFLVSAAAFWATDAVGVARLAFFFSLFPSGFLVPLAFMPGWLQAVCQATPFPGMIDTPVSIYLEHAQGADALARIGLQALWAVALIVAGRWALEAGRRKLTIQGG